MGSDPTEQKGHNGDESVPPIQRAPAPPGTDAPSAPPERAASSPAKSAYRRGSVDPSLACREAMDRVDALGAICASYEACCALATAKGPTADDSCIATRIPPAVGACMGCCVVRLASRSCWRHPYWDAADCQAEYSTKLPALATPGESVSHGFRDGPHKGTRNADIVLRH